MAETKKKSQGGSRTKKAAPPAEEKKTAPSKPESQKNDDNQFWSIVLFALGVLSGLMAAVPGSSGWRWIHNMLLGMFGGAVFFVPVILIYTAILIGMEKSSKCVSGRAVWGVALALLSGAAIQIFAVGKLPGHGIMGTVKALYSAGKELQGGGVTSIVIAGPLLAFFGGTGAKIIAFIMFFVFGMLLTGLGLIQFFELLTRPFRHIWNGLLDVRSIITGDYDDDEEDDDELNDDDDEEINKEYVAEKEALAIVNGKSSTRRRQRSPVADEPDFLFDVPLPTDSLIQSAESADVPDAAVEKPQTPPVKKLVKVESSAADPALDKLISDAADAAEKKKNDSLIEEPQEKPAEKEALYLLPPMDLLTPPDGRSNSASATAEMHDKADIIVNTLKSFGVTVRIVDVCRGPAITRYEIQPGVGVPVKKIKSLEDDLSLYLAAQIRIEAPVPGKSVVGIEVPNTNKDMVTLREILSSGEFRDSKSKLAFAVGKDIAGNCIVGDVARMPHVIIAGTTGSGKSVCTRSIIMSILYNAKPEEVKLILIDPKIVEFKIFDGIPHLLIPIVTEVRKAAGALNWAVNEMMRRYQTFADRGATDIKSFNSIADSDPETERMPQIVVFIDELADLMVQAKKEVEEYICRLAQMGRAAGMHLVVATQRPTTDVITGLIKANIPSRIALSVMSQIDSRTIIDMAGADKLLGNGDMLYMPIGSNKPVRVQGCFASTKDINETLEFIKSQGESEYDSSIIEAVENFVPAVNDDSRSGEDSGSGAAAGSDEDYIERAIEFAVNNGQLSTSMLQRKLKLGYARAARIVDELEERGVIGPNEGAKPRRVLMSKMQYDERRLRLQQAD